MRNNIFAVRPIKSIKPATQAKKGSIKVAKPARSRKSTVSQEESTSPAPSRPAHCLETASPQKWSQGRLEGAIQDIITTMEEARRNSHPEMFSRIWQAQMARLVEYEQYEKQEADIESSTHGESNPQNGDLPDTPDTVSSPATDDEDTTMVDASPSTKSSINNNSPNELQADQASSSRHQSIPATTNTTPTSDRIDAQPQPQPHTQQPPPPTLPATTTTYPYLPPSLPHVLSAYITPFSPTAATSPNAPTSSDQPYLWPDAPCHETSYPAFRSGIRLRAGIPDRIGDDKLGIVIAYAWNDSCRAVMSEGDWRNGFVRDLRGAARRGVLVWRVRVCCVAL